MIRIYPISEKRIISVQSSSRGDSEKLMRLFMCAKQADGGRFRARLKRPNLPAPVVKLILLAGRAPSGKPCQLTVNSNLTSDLEDIHKQIQLAGDGARFFFCHISEDSAVALIELGRCNCGKRLWTPSEITKGLCLEDLLLKASLGPQCND